MLFRHLLLAASLSFGCFTGGVAANEMKKVFDYYAQGSPGTYSTEKMKHWTGASFSGRNALNEPDIYQLPTINMGGSCKGLDFHASGFGLVTKDEIVQMARGIAQGAPGYFFNMAIGAVCPGCLQNINEYMRKLEQFNQLTRNSCENVWNAASNALGLPVERAGAQAAGKGTLADTFNGKLTSWGNSLDEYYADVEAGLSVGGVSEDVAEEILNDNVVYTAMRNAFQSGYVANKFPGSSITVPELAMSLFGTVITQVKKGLTKEIIIDTKSPAPNVTPLKLLTLPKGGVEKVSFYKCLNEDPADYLTNKCLDVAIEADNTFVGIETVFREKLLGDGSAAGIGILRKIQNRQNLSTEEVVFIQAFRMPYLRIAVEARGEQVTQLGERFALQMGAKFIHDLYRETAGVMYRSLRAQPKVTDKAPVDYRAKVADYIKDAEKDLEDMDKHVKERLEAIDKTLQSLYALKMLNQMESDGGRL